MERSQYDLLEVLDHIEPAELDYQQWLNIGMALDLEGYSVDVWDNWSRRDPGRYHPGECQKKWKGFKGNGSPVTGGTIVQYAREQGWTPPYDPGHALGWEDTISSEEGVFIDRNWVEGKEVREPARFDPAKELIRYLETLFEAGENVGYVVKSWQKDDKWLPADKGSFDRTAGQLIEALSACGGDIGSVLGDYDPQAGAWIRFNPLDGKGVRNDNVTDFRYALVRLMVKWCFPKGKHADGEYRITKPDTDNLQKLLKDCMTACGFWKDDALVAAEMAEKFWAEIPGIYVRIEEI